MKQKTGCINVNFAIAIVSIVGFALLLNGCSPVKQSLRFDVSFNNTRLNCADMKFQSAGNWQIQRLRFFVSEFELKKDGKWQNVSYQNGPWQTNSTAMISLTAKNCDDSSQFNNKLVFSSNVAIKDAQGMRFKLGVPYEINHLDPLSQPSPLNMPDMFWSWQLGHKFFRLDLQGDDRGWAFHLGSIGCRSDSRVRSPKSPCRQPNLFEIELPTSKSGAVVLNLDLLLEQLDLSQASSCMFHGRDFSSCETLLKNLQQQQVFVWQ